MVMPIFPDYHKDYRWRTHGIKKFCMNDNPLPNPLHGPPAHCVNFHVPVQEENVFVLITLTFNILCKESI